MKKILGIRGYLGVSLIDFPNEVSSVIFLGGCQMTCSYCHNKELLLKESNLMDMDFVSILKLVKENKKMLDGVVLTGGEPTVHKDIFLIAQEIKKIGMKVKLDTNGMRPDVIKKMITNDLVDYIALDLKTSPKNYINLGAPKDSDKRIVASVNLVKEQVKVKYELRTTFVPKYVNDKVFPEMKELIDGSKFYFLQATLDVDRTKMRHFASLVMEKCDIQNFGMRNY